MVLQVSKLLVGSYHLGSTGKSLVFQHPSVGWWKPLLLSMLQFDCQWLSPTESPAISVRQNQKRGSQELTPPPPITECWMSPRPLLFHWRNCRLGRSLGLVLPWLGGTMRSACSFSSHPCRAVRLVLCGALATSAPLPCSGILSVVFCL